MYFTTYGLLKGAIDTPPQGVFTPEEMVDRFRILNALNEFNSKFDITDIKDEHLSLNDVLNLEDADFNKLKEVIKLMKWAVMSTTIVELTEKLK
jgi:hypothetical protein